jgi:hypothetical protein
LHTNELERLRRRALFLHAQRDNFLNSFHEKVEGPRLRVAAVQSRHRGHVIPLGISFNNHVKV